MKEQPPNHFRRAGKRTDRHVSRAGAFEQNPRNQHTANQHAGNSKQHRHPAAFAAVFYAGVQKHDHEDEQHHDRSGIDNHLHRRHKLRAQQQIFHRERAHDHDQRQRAVDGMPLHQQIYRAGNAHQPKHRKYNQMKHRSFLRYALNATIKAVITRFAMASGSRNFHPNAINWS